MLSILSWHSSPEFNHIVGYAMFIATVLVFVVIAAPRKRRSNLKPEYQPYQQKPSHQPQAQPEQSRGRDPGRLQAEREKSNEVRDKMARATKEGHMPGSTRQPPG